MTNETGVMAGPVEDAAPVASAASPKPTRPFYWSVRRELWENRSIWIAPLITAAFLLPFYLLVLVVMARPGRVPDLPYEIVTSFMLAAMLLVWVFYCADALHGERRDRSILFWKSLPVSDLTTVLSKAAVPMVVLPIVIFAITAAMQLVLWLAHKATGLMVGVPVQTPGPFPLLRTWGTLLYGLVAMTLWVAPIYAWFLLVSAWARRAALVWALLPFVSLSAPGKVGLLTRFFIDRLTGWATEAFASKPREVLLIDPLNPIAPAKFLSNANLWMGLAVAALLLFAAARVRRRRSPL